MKNWSLSKKIWGILGLLVLSFIGTMYFTLTRMNLIRDSLNEITTVTVKRDQYTWLIQDSQRQLRIFSRDMILQKDPATRENLQKSFENVSNELRKYIAEYKEIASAEGKEQITKYEADLEIWLAATKNAIKFALEGKDAEAAESLFSVGSVLERMRLVVVGLSEMTTRNLNEKSAEANAMAQNAIWMSILVSSIAIVISILVAFFVLKALTRTIAEIVKDLSDSSMQVTSAATQIASASEELSQATTEQAASLEETAASVEEMNSMVAKNSENARAAEQTSGKSQDSVLKGKQIVQRMVESMESINRSSEALAETVKVIEQIDKKTKVINEIVNKTELLSFNASVEAARAGEHGKGFAVVAEEVGNLARMSGAAAEEIAALLEESINKVNQMVAETKKNVEVGTQVTQECGAVFEEIVQNVNSVSGMASEIASASQEQARGCSEITKAMSQLDQMTQQNATTSEECASAAEELSAQAEALKNIVTRLVFTVNGTNSDHTHFDSAHVNNAAQPAAKKEQTTKVVHLKSKQTSTAPVAAEPALKKAVGEAPDYDSEGFKDV